MIKEYNLEAHKISADREGSKCGLSSEWKKARRMGRHSCLLGGRVSSIDKIKGWELMKMVGWK